MNLFLTAQRIETIIDDDECLSSFCVWFVEGGYLAFARETGSDEVEVEFLDQVNGFITKNAIYRFFENSISFLIMDGKFFDKKDVVEITVDISKDQFNLPEIEECIKSIFG